MAKYLDKAGLEHFWTNLKNLFNSKVDKVSGKGLSTNDFTDTYETNLVSCNSAKHTHSNKAVLDTITAAKIAKWDSGSLVVSYGTIDVQTGVTLTFLLDNSNYCKMILSDIIGETKL